MKLFVDTSALVKFYYPEDDSEAIESLLLSSEKILICELASVELASALARKVRMKELSKKEKKLIWQAYNNDLLSTDVELIRLEETDYFKAAELIMNYGERESLRTLDALQLAAALKVSDALFLTADKTFQNVASKLGVKSVF